MAATSMTRASSANSGLTITPSGGHIFPPKAACQHQLQPGDSTIIYLVTGVAGFIGFHVASQLCAAGHQVVGIDNLNDYYEVSLKEARLAQLASFPHFHFERLDLADCEAMATLFARHGFERVIHLGAQAGVRYSIDNPFAYADSNLTGMLTVLEGCRHHGIQHLIYASSSSVYGMGDQMPYSTAQQVDRQSLSTPPPRRVAS